MPTASAGPTITDTAQINPGVVATADLADQAVDTTKIKTEDIRSDDIKDGEIVNADISASAAIADTKLAQITTAGKVSGAAITSLSSLPAGAGVIPSANLPGGSDLTCIPMPVLPATTVNTKGMANPVDGYVALFNLVRGITLNKLTLNVTAVGVAGTIKVGIFSEDGQTKYGEATSGTISGTGEATITFSNLVLPAGNLIFLFVTVGSANITFSRWVFVTTVDGLRDVTSEPSITGQYTCTSGTVPSTITLASISVTTDGGQFLMRLDN